MYDKINIQNENHNNDIVYNNNNNINRINKKNHNFKEILKKDYHIKNYPSDEYYSNVHKPSLHIHNLSYHSSDVSKNSGSSNDSYSYTDSGKEMNRFSTINFFSDKSNIYKYTYKYSKKQIEILKILCIFINYTPVSFILMKKINIKIVHLLKSFLFDITLNIYNNELLYFLKIFFFFYDNEVYNKYNDLLSYYYVLVNMFFIDMGNDSMDYDKTYDTTNYYNESNKNDSNKNESNKNDSNYINNNIDEGEKINYHIQNYNMDTFNTHNNSNNNSESDIFTFLNIYNNIFHFFFFLPTNYFTLNNFVDKYFSTLDEEGNIEQMSNTPMFTNHDEKCVKNKIDDINGINCVDHTNLTNHINKSHIINNSNSIYNFNSSLYPFYRFNNDNNKNAKEMYCQPFHVILYKKLRQNIKCPDKNKDLKSDDIISDDIISDDIISDDIISDNKKNDDIKNAISTRKDFAKFSKKFIQNIINVLIDNKLKVLFNSFLLLSSEYNSFTNYINIDNNKISNNYQYIVYALKDINKMNILRINNHFQYINYNNITDTKYIKLFKNFILLLHNIISIIYSYNNELIYFFFNFVFDINNEQTKLLSNGGKDDNNEQPLNYIKNHDIFYDEQNDTCYKNVYPFDHSTNKNISIKNDYNDKNDDDDDDNNDHNNNDHNNNNNTGYCSTSNKYHKQNDKKIYNILNYQLNEGNKCTHMENIKEIPSISKDINNYIKMDQKYDNDQNTTNNLYDIENKLSYNMQESSSSNIFLTSYQINEFIDIIYEICIYSKKKDIRDYYIGYIIENVRNKLSNLLNNIKNINIINEQINILSHIKMFSRIMLFLFFVKKKYIILYEQCLYNNLHFLYEHHFYPSFFNQEKGSIFL
ncbi:hypothetical protein PFDG_00935 [Plasmodium falciparum Dd2]|uniref:Uncharacterized protein n=1 Tax=Plasmodium falciparum (isolate Dd2) TaxID=57267 RepID=A0A0L7LYB3_PLAF4|nr:hypothetical protein PFDG_00935 [Plasmodium falciparum Dd2]